MTKGKRENKTVVRCLRCGSLVDSSGAQMSFCRCRFVGVDNDGRILGEPKDYEIIQEPKENDLAH